MADRIDKVKTWMEIFQAIATVVAIVCGLIWFLQQRLMQPQVKIEQTVTQRPVVDHPDQSLISVDVRATNVGKVKVELEPGVMNLLQMNPVLNKPKPLGGKGFQLKRLTLEPGESDQAIFTDFVVKPPIRTIQVHSKYRVPGKQDEYWNLLSFVDIGAEPSAKEVATSVH